MKDIITRIILVGFSVLLIYILIKKIITIKQTGIIESEYLRIFDVNRKKNPKMFKIGFVFEVISSILWILIAFFLIYVMLYPSSFKD